MHTIKTQVEIGASTLLIYSIRFAKGSVHDFSLFKESSSDYNENSTLFIDKGYTVNVYGFKRKNSNKTGISDSCGYE